MVYSTHSSCWAMAMCIAHDLQRQTFATSCLNAFHPGSAYRIIRASTSFQLIQGLFSILPPFHRHAAAGMTSYDLPMLLLLRDALGAYTRHRSRKTRYHQGFVVGVGRRHRVYSYMKKVHLLEYPTLISYVHCEKTPVWSTPADVPTHTHRCRRASRAGSQHTYHRCTTSMRS